MINFALKFMLKVISIKCANCGAGLEITPEMEQFSCGYCGATQIVYRQGGTVSLKIIGDAIRRVQVGVDKTAAELAITRLTKEQQKIQRMREDNELLKVQTRSANSTFFLRIWGICQVTAILFCMALPSYGAGAFFFLFLTISVVIVYLSTHKTSKVSSDFDEKERVLVKT